MDWLTGLMTTNAASTADVTSVDGSSKVWTPDGWKKLVKLSDKEPLAKG